MIFYVKILLGDIMVLSIIECNHYGIVEVIYLIKSVLNVIRIIVPIILIIICMIDVIKVVTGDMEKNKKWTRKFVQKILAASVVFLLPTIISIVMNVVEGIDLMDEACWSEATPEKIEMLKQQAIEDSKQSDKDINSSLKDQTGNLIDDTELIIDPGNKNPGNSNSGHSNTASKYFFLGDSRFTGMSASVGTKKDTYWVTKVGAGYKYLNEEANKMVTKSLPSDGSSYIFVNLGVNDMHSVSSYINKYKSLAKNEWKNQKIVFVAVGPKIGSGCYNYVNNNQIESFNQKMKDGLNGISNIYYCDAYNDFKDYKIAASCEIHYTNETYKKLYNFIMSHCRF